MTAARSAVALGCIGLAAACANAMAPPGGERDVTPPGILELRPEPMSTVEASDRPVVIVFDERISERNYRDAVYVSPVTGALDLSKGRDELEVRLAGGWQPGRVYRVVVQPVLQDLFNNAMSRPIEFAFSTGAPFPDAAAAGLVFERVTGARVGGARVEARPVEGGAYHLAITDTSGIFRLPLLPPGSYVLRGYVDQNRDRRADEFEPIDSTIIELGRADTVLRPLALMRVDSTAANVTRVVVVDSVTLSVELDDYMDVSRPQDRASVRVRSLPDSAIVPLAGVHYPHVLRAQRARQDSIARDSAAAAAAAARDTLAVDTLVPGMPRPDTAAADAQQPPAQRPPADPRRADQPGDTTAADTVPPDPLVVRVREAGFGYAPETPVPARELMVVLAEPLVPEAEYLVEVAGILNLAGIAGGGGSATFTAPAAPAPPDPPAEGAPAEDAAPQGEEDASPGEDSAPLEEEAPSRPPPALPPRSGTP